MGLIDETRVLIRTLRNELKAADYLAPTTREERPSSIPPCVVAGGLPISR